MNSGGLKQINVFACCVWEDFADIQNIIGDINSELGKQVLQSSTLLQACSASDYTFNKIADAELIFAFLSQNSKSNTDFQQCLLHAIHLNKNIIPIEMNKSLLSGSLPSEIKFRIKPYNYKNDESRMRLFAQLKAVYGVVMESGDYVGALIHIISDTDVKVYRYGEYLGIAYLGKDFVVRLEKGKHTLFFHCIDFPDVKCSVECSVKSSADEDYIQVELKKELYKFLKKNGDRKTGKNHTLRYVLLVLILVVLAVGVYFFSEGFNNEEYYEPTEEALVYEVNCEEEAAEVPAEEASVYVVGGEEEAEEVLVEDTPVYEDAINTNRVEGLISNICKNSSKNGDFESLENYFTYEISPHPSGQKRYNYNIGEKTKKYVDRFPSYNISSPYNFSYENSSFPLVVKCDINVSWIDTKNVSRSALVHKTFYITSDYKVSGYVDEQINL